MANRHEPWVTGGDGVDPIMAEATQWFVRLHEDPTIVGARTDFETWRQSDPRHAAAFSRLQRLWGASAHLKSLSETSTSPDRRRLILGAACVGATTLAAGFGGRIVMGAHPFATYRTRAGERAAVALADGSRLELSTATAVTVDLSAARRRIRLLDGEAWFDVARDTARPFVVEAAGGAVTALGTAFAVARLRRSVRVAVTEHAVQVAVGKNQARLRQGQEIVYSSDGLGPVTPFTSYDLAWRSGRLNFIDRPLAEVAAVLDRWTGGRTVILNDDIAARPVTLTLGCKDAGQGLNRLASVSPFRIHHPLPGVTVVTRM